MGFPAQALQCRADNKMYRIQVREHVDLGALNHLIKFVKPGALNVVSAIHFEGYGFLPAVNAFTLYVC